ATMEELYLLQKLARDLGSDNIDHRLHTRDFDDDRNDPQFPWLGVDIAKLETADTILVIGSNIRHEVPILAHRLRKAGRSGAKVSFMNPPGYEYLFPIHQYSSAPLSELGNQLAALLGAVESDCGQRADLSVPRGPTDDTHRAIAQSLLQGEQKHLLLGNLATRHPAFSQLRAISAAIAKMTGATIGYLPESSNAAGAYLAGAVPHRGPGGTPISQPGRNAREMLSETRDAYVLFGFEPQHDTAQGQAAIATLRDALFVVVLASWLDPTAIEYADVILPIGTFAETAGTYVNMQGDLQSFSGVAKPVGEARPGWKVLRVLGNELGLEGYVYNSAEEVLAAATTEIGDIRPDNALRGTSSFNGAHYTEADMPADVSIYAVDPLVRRSRPLQRTRDARKGAEL
ncbi:MAG: molybdopterin-dependent oxidoreductase, partial [Gammaproteobacteria bacterium]|nr:molybdopterin-dependent oxidoreductase [Gammaproteobacteria bacterium]